MSDFFDVNNPEGLFSVKNREKRENARIEQLKDRFSNQSGIHNIIIMTNKYDDIDHYSKTIETPDGKIPDTVIINGEVFTLDDHFVVRGEDRNAPVYKLTKRKDYDPLFD